jgi:hypothetical protein
METSLHRALKQLYAAGGSGRPEVVLQGFRVDAVDEDGRLVEVQSGSLGPLRDKLKRLLPEHRIRIIKPLFWKRRLVRRSSHSGPDRPVRTSPKRGELVDVFDDLVGLARVFPHVHLDIEILAVTIEEVRVPRRRWPGYAVTDRRLGEIHGTTALKRASDLWALLPPGCRGPEAFTTRDLARQLARPLWFAQRVAYCLRHSGAARVMGKTGNHLIYTRQN